MLKQKLISSLIILAVAVIPLACSTAHNGEYYSIWDGTASAPALIGGVYEIDTAAQFAWLCTDDAYTHLNEDYILNTNIDLGGRDWTPIGNVAPFSGTFNGGHHTIRGLSLPNDQTSVGLFAQILGFTTSVQNLKIQLANCTIDNNKVLRVGVLTGFASGAVEINNIAISGSSLIVKSSASNILYVGSIAGQIIEGVELTGSYSNINVSGESTTSIVYAGGLVGYASGLGTEIKSCYTSGDVTAKATTTNTAYAGGIAGASNSITNCAALNKSVEAIGASSTSSSFRIVGSTSGTLLNNHANQNMTVKKNSSNVNTLDGAPSHGLNVNYNNMWTPEYLESTFGWIATDWKITAGQFPTLSWE